MCAHVSARVNTHTAVSVFLCGVSVISKLATLHWKTNYGLIPGGI